ncbi:MAG: VPLPA-CTERM sorting domain-containing protein [Pseudomonadota bacterium]
MRYLLPSIVALCVSAGAASASTITFETFTVANYNATLATLGGNVISEDFESFSEGNVGGVGSPFATSVGTFETLGGTGSGGTVTGELFGGVANDGTQLAIRDGNVFGRTSTTAALTGNSADDTFLDSNDTLGISFIADLGGLQFDRILLTLTDAADTGASVTVTAGGDSVIFDDLSNANQQTLLIDFGGLVSSAQIDFTNSKVNDGFSLDDISVAAVPLPAAGWMLLAGLAGLFAMRRRRLQA